MNELKYIDKKVYFYDPHPGLAGCTKRLDDSIRMIVETLDKETFTLRDAARLIGTFIKDGDVLNAHPPRGNYREGYITLHRRKFKNLNNLYKYNWRLIRYREFS